MTAQMPMAAHMRMAELSELLPETSPARPQSAWLGRLARLLPSRRRLCGLAAIPERYRLQFLLLADAAMPGRPEADVAAMADALADRTRPPKRLLAQLPETTGLDRWFKDRTDQIKATLAELLEAEA
jgi:hypothetical protein